MINLQSITLQRGTKLLFKNVFFAIFDHQKVGLIGVNGCGKSSLFALLLGNITQDAGNIYLQPKIRIAYLAQEAPNTEISALQYAMQGDSEATELIIETRLIASLQIADVHDRLYEIDGYTLEARAAKILNGLGFKKSEHSKPVNSFSGGWRMRLNLAQVLLSRADLLLLDEPTNYLDMDAIVWLERWLQKYQGALIVISHDREFLDNVVQKILYVHNQTIDLYSGNYSGFEEQRAAQLAQEQSLYVKQQAKIEHLTKYVNRFRAKASKARQAQSRLKMLEKMEKVEITHFDSPFTFQFLATKPCSSPLVRFSHVNFNYGEYDILQNVNFSLGPQDRIGILGVNGAGKSTFMKLLAGKLTPTTGEVFINRDLAIGYFAQHQVEQLDLQESAAFHIASLGAKIPEQKIRTFLGSFGFSGDMAFGKIENFSGGEKARLVLAMLIWQKPNLLLLDEPTNHLDLDMREALAFALQDYTGALVLVAHDRHLLKATVDEFYLVNDQHIAKFNGDLDDYKNWLLDLRKTSDNTNNYQKKSKETGNTKQLQKIEKKLNALYTEQDQIKAMLGDATIYQPENKSKLDNCLQRSANLGKAIKVLEEEWLN